jgi:hypothetical protein
MKSLGLVVLFIAIFVTSVACQPLFKIFCAGLPLFRGRVDTIVEPGAVSNHVHRVSGGSGFAPEAVNADPITVYNHLRQAKCSTCSIPIVDMTAYWHPDLYYMWPNKSLSLIPTGGLTVYYEGRQGNGNQSNPQIKAFPPGFRMTAGDPFRRSFNSSIVAQTAVQVACLAAQPNKETNGFPDPSLYCLNGMRMQVYFPQCWNGKDIDSPNHQSHVAYPIDRYDNGDCPPGFPVRLMSVFFEAFYSTGDFPQQNYNPYVLACGDSTGYGFHGDFMSGWDPVILQQAINDPSCDGKVTNNGNNVRACKPLSSYVVDQANGLCQLDKPIPLTEDLGMVYPLPNMRLPGCQPVTGPNSKDSSICTSPPSQSYSGGIDQRFLLKSKSTGKYVTQPVVATSPLVANLVAANPTLQEVFAPVPWSSGNVKGITLISEAAYGLHSWCGTHGNLGAITCNSREASTDAGSYEAFIIVPQTGNYIAIKANMNNKYITVQADGTLAPTSDTIGDAQLFERILPDGGHL